jgi:hypothetical protein
VHCVRRDLRHLREIADAVHLIDHPIARCGLLIIARRQARDA